MAIIKIDDLKLEEIEERELSDQEIQFILGGCCCNTHTETDLGNVSGTGTPISAEEFDKY